MSRMGYSGDLFPTWSICFPQVEAKYPMLVVEAFRLVFRMPVAKSNVPAIENKGANGTKTAAQEMRRGKCGKENAALEMRHRKCGIENVAQEMRRWKCGVENAAQKMRNRKCGVEMRQKNNGAAGLKP